MQCIVLIRCKGLGMEMGIGDGDEMEMGVWMGIGDGGGDDRCSLDRVSLEWSNASNLVFLNAHTMWNAVEIIHVHH